MGNNMDGYLGEFIQDISESKYKDYTSTDWVILWIERYGSIGGEHHKNWVLDQVAQILMGTKVGFKIAKWKNGHQEERFYLNDPSDKYMTFADSQGDYDKGIAP